MEYMLSYAIATILLHGWRVFINFAVMISIVIPLYNKEKQVGSTLRSVLAQTYQDFEVVVVDDGSTDGSVAVVEAIDDPRIRIIRQKNGGVSAARNTGIREAKGEFISFLDADDEWKPEYLATQTRLIQTYPECDVFATNYELKDESGTVTPTILHKLPFDGQDGILENYFEVASCSHPPIYSTTIIIKKSAIKYIGGFPEGIKSGEDLLTWARLACRYKIAYSKKPMAIYAIQGLHIYERPRRIPASNDVVGIELYELKKEYKTKAIGKYISLWHKMRSSIYLRLNMRRASIHEAWKALKYNPLNFKLYMYITYNLIPSWLKPDVVLNTILKKK